MTLPEERRHRRSNDPLVALHYQLARARRDGRFEAVVVADDSGVVVAGAGAWATCEELAAYAPLFRPGNRLESTRGEASRMAELRAEVDVQPVEVDGRTVLLCARGGDKRARAMEHVAPGVARILTSHAI